jgi:hypothetical protein
MCVWQALSPANPINGRFIAAGANASATKTNPALSGTAAMSFIERNNVRLKPGRDQVDLTLVIRVKRAHCAIIQPECKTFC